MDTLSISPANPRLLPEHLQFLNPLVVANLVRLGNPADGGYIVPSSLIARADALLSFGLAEDWTFERDVARLNPGIAIHVYDHSVGDRAFMERVVSTWRGANGADKAEIELEALITLYESYRRFFRERFIHFQERVVDVACKGGDADPERIFARLGSSRSLILKMDIECGEYRVIDPLLAYQGIIPLMIIEFHATKFLRKLFLEKITNIRRHYEIIHIHGNNYAELATDGLPDVIEMTFMHRDLCASSSRRNCLPIAGLDFPNNPAEVDHPLLFAES